MSQDSEREMKPKIEGQTKTETDHITLKVSDQKGAEVTFKVKKTTTMEKLKKSYAERMGSDVKLLKFTFDGVIIQNADTPQSLGMEDNDSIDVHTNQEGG